MSFNRINAYRIMWVLVFFDLPVETTRERKAATEFRKELLRDGFTMFQFSIYLRNCPSKENADVHVNRVKKLLPKKGHVGILSVTDRQLSQMEIFFGKKEVEIPTGYQQLELF